VQQNVQQNVIKQNIAMEHFVPQNVQQNVIKQNIAVELPPLIQKEENIVNIQTVIKYNIAKNYSKKVILRNIKRLNKNRR